MFASRLEQCCQFRLREGDFGWHGCSPDFILGMVVAPPLGEAAGLTGEWKPKLGRAVCINGAHDGPELALVRFDPKSPADASRRLLWCELRFLHRQLPRGIGDRVNLNGIARALCDVPIGDQVNIEQAFGSVAGSQEVDFTEATAPAFQPEQQFSRLVFGTLHMQQQVDITLRTCGCVLRAANEVERLDAEQLRIDLCRDPLRHPEAPAPVFFAGTINDPDVRFRLSLSLSWR